MLLHVWTRVTRTNIENVFDDVVYRNIAPIIAPILLVRHSSWYNPSLQRTPNTLLYSYNNSNADYDKTNTHMTEAV